ncbi:MAG: hypothetical protein WA130_15360 [Candidatus Methanoperedens sp.]
MGLIENERAQFMLLAGFIIAIGLVITTVMLNNIIFESNMAGEAGGDHIKYDMVNLMRISGDEIKSAYRNVTTPGQNPALKVTNFTKQMQNFNENISQIYALHGEVVNLSLDISNWNSIRYANFTDNGTASGTANWTVIENVSSSNISMNVIVTSGTFQILLKNASSSLINLTAGTHTGLIFANSTIADPYSISFINGSNAYGNYSIAGIASGKNFNRSRDYILNATIFFSTSNMRANITIPVAVPW